MSKYTTEVRYICESEAGYDESKGWSDIDETLEKSWNKIFTTGTPFFDETYRRILCKKILKHYYLREICSETVGIWKLWLNTRLEEIMPYYNKLYESELIKFNPLHNTNLTRTKHRTQDDTIEAENKMTSAGKDTEDTDVTTTDNSSTQNRTTETGTITDTKSGTTTNSGTSSSSDSGTTSDSGRNLYSDTPQGSVSGLDNNTYLTNATIDSRSGSSSNNSQGSTSNTETVSMTNNNEADRTNETNIDYIDNATSNTDREVNRTYNRTEDNDKTINTIEDYLEDLVGNSGENNSVMMLKYRETFLNIDMQIINEFSDLFFGLW